MQPNNRHNVNIKTPKARASAVILVHVKSVEKAKARDDIE